MQGIDPQPLGFIFDVQRCSLHDGPGLRTTVFFKGCPLRCSWCQNPESQRRAPELAFYKDRCQGALSCLTACPRGALRAGAVRIDRRCCDGCGRCAAACAFGALERIGRAVSVEGLLETVARDRPFFEASGGGVTLSGGEPCAQLGFVGAFARRCVEAGLRIGLQTCGAFAWEAFAPLLPSIEFIHFDLKALEPALHRQLTGAENGAILTNARRLVEAGAPVVFRALIVPGHNDASEALDRLADGLESLGVSALHLLAHHALGEVKRRRLGDDRPALEIPPGAAAVAVERARARLVARGLEITT